MNRTGELLRSDEATAAENVGGRVILKAAAPVQREWQRHPSHPATTNLLPILYPELFASNEPFSTFSLNVSDVSFKLAQASLELAPA